MKNYCILFCMLFLTCLNIKAQMFQMSNLKIDYDNYNNILKFSVTGFTTHFEKATGIKRINDTKFKKAIKNYIDKTIVFKLNNNLIKYDNYQIIISANSIRFVSTKNNIKNIKNIFLKVLLFTDILKDQHNIINIDINGLKKTINLDNNHTIYKLSLEG